MFQKTAFAIAVLTSALSDTGDGWVQLLPAGDFSAPDGRPFDVPGGKWRLSAEVAQRLIAKAALRKNPMVIDYEHQTLNSEKNGQAAPAAGWSDGSAMEWREGQGLYIKPSWTKTAQAYLANDEYRFLSAVFPYSKVTGEPQEIRMAALTNDPGLDGLESITAQATLKFIQPNPTEIVMDPKLIAILKSLGIDLASDATPTAAQLDAATTALATLKASADSVAAKNTEITALKASSMSPDLTSWVPKATYDAMVVEVAVLRADTNAGDAKTLLDDAFKNGKFMAAERDYLESFGDSQGVAALKTMMDARPMLSALNATQAKGKKTEKNTDNLTAEDEAVLKATGLDRAAFIAAKAVA